MTDKELIIKIRKAMKAEDMETVNDIIEKNPDLLEVITPFGTLLHDAALFGIFEMARYFVTCGIDVNKKAGLRKSSAIAYAASEGYLNIVELLYDHGAILDVSTPEGNPLFASIPDNHVEVAKFLIDHGIDITAKYDIGDIDGCDAMEYARQYGSTEIYEYLKRKRGKL